MASVDFSDKITGTQPCFSPDNRYVANAQDCRITIRETETLAVAAMFSCLATVNELAWSPNNPDHILALMRDRATVQVFSISDMEWNMTISEGLAGIAAARWSPNGRYILLVAEFQIKLSVWSLVDQSCIQMQAPKHPDAGFAFAPDGSMLALIERTECKDFLTIYDVTSWKSLNRFALPTTDAADLAWSPDSLFLAVWDSPSQGHRLLILTPSGTCVANHSEYKEGLGIKSVQFSPSGQLLAVGTYEQGATLLESATWKPLTTFSHKPTITGPAEVIVYREVQEESDHVLTNSNGTRASREVGSGTIGEKKGGSGPTVVPRRPSSSSSLSRPSFLSRTASLPSSTTRNGAGGKPIGRPSTAGARGSTAEDLAQEDEERSVRSRYIVSDLPVQLPIPKSGDRDREASLVGLGASSSSSVIRAGVGLTAWSADGTFLATREDSMPHVVWIWHSATLALVSVLIQVHPVKSLSWEEAPNNSTSNSRLAIASGSGRVYLWSPEGASCVHVPVKGMRTTGLQWSKRGSDVAGHEVENPSTVALLLLTGRDGYSCAYFS